MNKPSHIITLGRLLLSVDGREPIDIGSVWVDLLQGDLLQATHLEVVSPEPEPEPEPLKPEPVPPSPDSDPVGHQLYRSMLDNTERWMTVRQWADYCGAPAGQQGYKLVHGRLRRWEQAPPPGIRVACRTFTVGSKSQLEACAFTGEGRHECELLLIELQRWLETDPDALDAPVSTIVGYLGRSVAQLVPMLGELERLGRISWTRLPSDAGDPDIDRAWRIEVRS